MSDPLAGTDWSHERATVNDVRLHYVAAGPETGPVVVLLHGFPEFWYSWRHQIPALAEAGYRVVAPDLRGYNVSEKPAGVAAYRIAELAADVAGLVEAVADGASHVVGHDWGGVVAWELAARHPRAVATLTAMNAPHPGPFLRELRRPRQALRSWYTLLFQLPWLPERLFRAGDYRLVERLVDGEAVRPDAFTDADVRRYKTALARPGALTAALNYYRALGRGTFRRTVRATRTGIDDPDEWTLTRARTDHPALVVWGLQDAALSPRALDGLDEWVPNVRVRRIDDASHWVQADAREAVNDSLTAFLDGVNEG